MTEIIATLGPASESPEQIRKLHETGVNFFRLNFSHGSHAEHGTRIERIREHTPKAKIVLDTKGPDIRSGDLPSAETITVEPADSLTLTIIPGEQNSTKRIVYVDYDDFLVDASAGDVIALDSGQIMLRAEEIGETSMLTKVITGGVITSRRHINLPGRDLKLPTIGEKEQLDLEFGKAQKVDIVALSFTRSREDIEEARSLAPGAEIWAKIENAEGLANFEEILAAADGLMIARGDLGVETPWAELPARQAEMLAAAQKVGKFTIVATEMIESMLTKNRPTRAEVADITLAVWQGASAVMLSAESAVGRHPVLCAQVMQDVIVAADKSRVSWLNRF